MEVWETVVVPEPEKVVPRTISITAETSHTRGYVYFSSGLNLKEGKYDLVSRGDVFGFVLNAAGKYTVRKTKTCKSLMLADKSLLYYLRDKLDLDKYKCYKYDAYIEGNIIVLDPTKLVS